MSNGRPFVTITGTMLQKFIAARQALSRDDRICSNTDAKQRCGLHVNE
jgi:hypothetical protein